MINYMDLVYTRSEFGSLFLNHGNGTPNAEDLLWPKVMACYVDKKLDLNFGDVGTMYVLITSVWKICAL